VGYLVRGVRVIWNLWAIRGFIDVLVTVLGPGLAGAGAGAGAGEVSPRLINKGDRNGLANVVIAAFSLLSLCRLTDIVGPADKLGVEREGFSGVDKGRDAVDAPIGWSVFVTSPDPASASLSILSSSPSVLSLIILSVGALDLFARVLGYMAFWCTVLANFAVGLT